MGGELGSDASIAVAEAAASVARTAGLSRKKSAQIAKFAKLVPILKGLTDLAGDTTADSEANTSKPAAGDDALELLDNIGLDLETGLDFLKKNNLDISDGLQLLDAVIGDDTGSFSLAGLGSASQLLGVGSLSLGATGGAEAIKKVESPELRAKLDKTNKLLTELEDSMEDQIHTAKATPASSMLGKDSLHSLVASLSSDDLCNFKKNIFTGFFCLHLASSKPAIHRNCMYN